MTYALLDAIALAIVAVVGVVALRRRPRLLAPIGIALVLTLVATAVFDNIMIAVGIMSYSVHSRSGIQIGLAPIEDFAYPVAAAVLLPSLWVLLGGRRESND
ncbi:lycopene cyclase domain-containing protein [Rathayibacter sp. YIM 133350]|uniref:lycopene cyclase domain-containing protein n=1 Tax=Rathayibacter sp. YIM 133350 TaxID=3131992 RepID=UPI00307E6283